MLAASLDGTARDRDRMQGVAEKAAERARLARLKKRSKIRAQKRRPSKVGDARQTSQ